MAGEMKRKIAITSLLVFVSLAMYSVYWNTNHYVPFEYFTSNSDSEGKEIVLDEVKITGLTEEGFLIEKDGAIIEVKGKSNPVKASGFVSIVGVLRTEEGYIEAKEIHYHGNLYSKYLLSPIGLILMLYFFFRDWRVTRTGLEAK